MNKNVEKKLKIENLTRCLNCSVFTDCSKERKESIVCCETYREVNGKEQLVVIKLEEFCRLEDAQFQKHTC